MSARERQAIGDLLGRAFATSDAMDRDDASGWLVVCVDLAYDNDVVGCYGPYDTPEEALVAAGRHQETSLPVDDGDPGWAHFVKPLYPKVH